MELHQVELHYQRYSIGGITLPKWQKIYVILPEQWLISIHFWLVTKFWWMLASNLNRLFLHVKQYHFQFPLGFSCHIRRMQIPCFVFFSLLQALHVYVTESWWFLLHMSCKFSLSLPFSSVLAMLSLWGSVVFVFWLRRYFDPPKSPKHPKCKHFQKIILIANYLFFSNATGGKNGSGSNWYLLLVIRFNANGDPPFETMRTVNWSSSDSHLWFVFQEAEERIPS